MSGKRRKKVSWTEDEMDLLAEKVVGSYLNNPGKSLIEIINGMQEMMPPDRRRIIVSVSQVPVLMEKVKFKLQNVKDLAKKGSQPPEKIFVESDPKEVVDSLHPSQLLLYFFQKVWGELEQQREVINRMELSMKLLQSTVPHHEEKKEQQQKKQRKLKIAVVGLLRHQFADVEAAIESVDFRFVERDHNQYLPSVDYVVLARKFIKHETQTLAFSQYPRDRVLLVDGAATNIIYELRNLLKKIL